MRSIQAPQPPYLMLSCLMGTRMSSGLQDSTREGVADVCLLHAGGGQLINCIISRAVGFPLSGCYGGLLVDVEQGSSITLIDKI